MSETGETFCHTLTSSFVAAWVTSTGTPSKSPCYNLIYSEALSVSHKSFNEKMPLIIVSRS